MIRFLLRLVLVLVLIAALLVGMTCCAAKAVFGRGRRKRNGPTRKNCAREGRSEARKRRAERQPLRETVRR